MKCSVLPPVYTPGYRQWTPKHIEYWPLGSYLDNCYHAVHMSKLGRSRARLTMNGDKSGLHYEEVQTGDCSLIRYSLMFAEVVKKFSS
jgi:hypothetical protein